MKISSQSQVAVAILAAKMSRVGLGKHEFERARQPAKQPVSKQSTARLTSLQGPAQVFAGEAREELSE